ncbi:5-oxoprolinase subunit PxpB [Chryseomicrobium imtechense]
MKSFWLSEELWILRFNQAETTSAQIRAIEKLITSRFQNVICETVSTTTTIGIYVSPHLTSEELSKLETEWRTLAQSETYKEDLEPRIIKIPVVYGGQEGPDLAFVAKHTGLSEEQVIAKHTSVLYPVEMIGFAPGFPYLAGLPEVIHAPRKQTPSGKIVAGSVGIAGSQTGVYSIATPGGWQIIGRTAVQLFLPNENPPSLLQPGDLIQFVAVGRDEDA